MTALLDLLIEEKDISDKMNFYNQLVKSNNENINFIEKAKLQTRDNEKLDFLNKRLKNIKEALKVNEKKYSELCVKHGSCTKELRKNFYFNNIID